MSLLLLNLISKNRSFIQTLLFRQKLQHFRNSVHLLYGSEYSTNSSTDMAKTKFIVSKRDESVVDDFFGHKVSDPYRWLEDPDAETTQAFVEDHNAITQSYLEDCEQREDIHTKLTNLWNYPKYYCPSKYGDKYFFYANTGLQNQNVLFMQNSLEDTPEVFLDPNGLSKDGTIALSQTEFSDDGNLFAYSLSESGSDWIKIKIRDVKTLTDFPETLERVKYSSITWTKDNKGLFYGKYPQEQNKVDGTETDKASNQKLYYHRIGEPQEKDVLVVEFPDEPSWRMSCDVSDCGKYFILEVRKDCRDNLVFFSNLEDCNYEIKGQLKLTQIVFEFKADFSYITNTDNIITFRTNKGAPNYKLINIDFNKPEESNWTTLLPEHATDVLEWALCVDHNKLIATYIHDVKTVIQVYSLETGAFIQDFPLEVGSVFKISGRKEYSEIFFQFISFLTPGIIYHYDFAKSTDGKLKVFKEIQLNLEGFDPNAYLVEQIFYESKDGEKIPMFIVSKRQSERTIRPCLLYGYGGFNVSILPAFSVTWLLFMDQFNGVLAFPNLRGGGEYGEKWHNAGRLFNKQNGFDDFQYAAKYLMSNGYTAKEKLVIQGGSNGGLLVAAAINQRPDLFGAAVAQVGVMDMLRFHKFTVGHAWQSDYGNPDEKEHFENLIKFSPIHNVKTPKEAEKQYPATLILTADHDDRVSPLHSLKYAATIHNACSDSTVQKNPLLLRVYRQAGHGAGKPTTKKIEEAVDILSFMYKTIIAPKAV